uniref:CCR4-Not complex component Not N-terminal domain-containing protein n=1 Tax=Lactuca sativa TaxID=4236 RepID=A0A9R1W0B8_LACSA|nr:hypothetical protein LSAT_V11C400221230 [Lactuca sativa]
MCYYRYQKSIEIYEEIAKQPLNNNLLKYGVRGHLLNVGISQRCKGDGNTGGEDRDAFIDAFSKSGVMQCPNCRKIEKGQWLYANGCRPYPEFSMDDWTHDEDLYDFSYSDSVEGDILNFSQVLRVIGIKPCEKVALFADNSCRCLDPKEKAKLETRDWLNNTVSELESQIDSFEAEMEGLFVKKGKARPPRLKSFCQKHSHQQKVHIGLV